MSRLLYIGTLNGRIARNDMARFWVPVALNTAAITLAIVTLVLRHI